MYFLAFASTVAFATTEPQPQSYFPDLRRNGVPPPADQNAKAMSRSAFAASNAAYFDMKSTSVRGEQDANDGYQPLEGEIKEEFKKFCAEEFQEEDHSRFVFKQVELEKGTEATIIVDKTKKVVFVAVRGTENWKDVYFIDFNEFDYSDLTQSWKGNVNHQVYKGFWRSFEILKSWVTEEVKRWAQLDPDYTFVFTGHSLGGATSILLAIHVAEEFPDLDIKKRVFLLTFSSPNVGNRAFSNYVEDTLECKNVMHIGHIDDSLMSAVMPEHRKPCNRPEDKFKGELKAEDFPNGKWYLGGYPHWKFWPPMKFYPGTFLRYHHRISLNIFLKEKYTQCQIPILFQ